MLNDIITEHKERMLNLKKYYPFFKLMDVSFAQFQEGRYEMLDMGYIVMGILRFFIEENNFKEKDVTYPEYLDFITSLLKRDFGLNLSAQEYKELADYIFDKIKNEGRPFTFPYYDPIEKKKCISRIKVLESAIRDHTVWYSISSDAIEFYLDTKEIKEESRISVQQLLLEKMIQAQNFQGGKDVIVRINEEVARLQRRKNEIMELLGKDVFAGIEAYEDFVHTGMRWFDEEEKLFKKNKDFIEGALAKIFDGAVGIRGNGAVVDLHPAPVVIDAAGTLRLEVAFCCSALVNGQVCRAVDKAAVAAGGFEVAAVDGYCTGVVYDDSLYGGCGHIIQSHTTAALTKECRSILQVCMSIFASINCYIAARASCINAVAVRLHLCIIYNKGSRPNHNRIEGY